MEPMTSIDYEPAQWERAEWVEGDVEGAPIVFFFEFNADGEVLRQVELAGGERVPIAAASLDEFWRLQGGVAQPATPELVRYEHRYGRVAEGSRHDWTDYPGEPISLDEFEAVWQRARAFLDNAVS